MSDEIRDERLPPKLIEILGRVEEAFGGDVILYNGPIGEDGYGQFVQASSHIKSDRAVILVLTTYGGSADSAYRIARYAQNFFKDFIVYVPSSCKSAGTLIALGASKILMSPVGEFGPLDVQVFKADEIFERRSGLLSKSAVWSLSEEAFRVFEQILIGIKMGSGGTIGFKAASQVAATITTGLIGPVVGQLDPLAIGEDYQNLHIARDYGLRLIEKFGTIDNDAVRALVEDYPSHGFVIDFFEATRLFGNVALATPDLMELQACLRDAMHRPATRDVKVFHLRDALGDDENGEEEPSQVGATQSGDRGDSASGQDQSSQQHDRHSPSGEGQRRSGNGASSEGNSAA